MNAKINPDVAYFCFSSYTTAGRPKMEAALFNYAEEIILYYIVCGEDFDNVLELLKNRQAALLHEHQNWKPTKFDFYENAIGTVWLHIGDSTLTLHEIRGNF